MDMHRPRRRGSGGIGGVGGGVRGWTLGEVVVLVLVLVLVLALLGRTVSAVRIYTPDPSLADANLPVGVSLLPNARPAPAARGARRLVLASHPLHTLDGRWLRTWLSAPDYFPDIFSQPGFRPAEPLRYFAARGFMCTAASSLAFTGSATASLHYGDMRGRAFWKLRQRQRQRQRQQRKEDAAAWSVHDVSNCNALLANDLDPNATYELQVVHYHDCQSPGGFLFLGVGLDNSTLAVPVPPPQPPRNLTLEFIGDSVTTIIHESSPIPSLLASIPQSTCALLNAACSVISRSSMELIDYPAGNTTGLSWAYFRRWIPTSSLLRRKSPPPMWNLRTQGFVPDAVIVHLGINDRAMARISPADALDRAFVASYLRLIRGIRSSYGNGTLIFVQLPFGRKSYSDWLPVFPPSLFTLIVSLASDPNVRLLNTTGWITRASSKKFIADAVHPNGGGMVHLAYKMADALRGAGVGSKPRATTPTRTPTSTPKIWTLQTHTATRD